MQPRLLALLREGRHLAIHCHGGSGRTGLAAALLLMTQGLPQQEAMTLIRATATGLHPGLPPSLARYPWRRLAGAD